jgi:hypothetical protein
MPLSDIQQTKADHDFVAEELALQTNTDLTREIHAPTTEMHRRMVGDEGSATRRMADGL